ncbi:MAG TPA: hypothetical protein VL147_04930 [Devosia sp.]|nr:hypothetical protein [Devosia sp.]
MFFPHYARWLIVLLQGLYERVSALVFAGRQVRILVGRSGGDIDRAGL